MSWPPEDEEAGSDGAPGTSLGSSGTSPVKVLVVSGLGVFGPAGEDEDPMLAETARALREAGAQLTIAMYDKRGGTAAQVRSGARTVRPLPCPWLHPACSTCCYATGRYSSLLRCGVRTAGGGIQYAAYGPVTLHCYTTAYLPTLHCTIALSSRSCAFVIRTRTVKHKRGCWGTNVHCTFAALLS